MSLIVDHVRNEASSPLPTQLRLDAAKPASLMERGMRREMRHEMRHAQAEQDAVCERHTEQSLESGQLAGHSAQIAHKWVQRLTAARGVCREQDPDAKPRAQARASRGAAKKRQKPISVSLDTFSGSRMGALSSSAIPACMLQEFQPRYPRRRTPYGMCGAALGFGWGRLSVCPALGIVRCWECRSLFRETLAALATLVAYISYSLIS